jgi:hypothetical protein
MGWSYGPKPADLREFFAGLYNHEVDGYKQRMLDVAVVNSSEAYIALEVERNAQREVIALVCLLKHTRDGKLGYKSMDETMQPYYYSCPERILKALTPTTNASALEWRSRCYRRLEERERVASLKPGVRFITASPIRFSDKALCSQFEVVKRQGMLVTARRFQSDWSQFLGLCRFRLPEQQWEVWKGG